MTTNESEKVLVAKVDDTQTTATTATATTATKTCELVSVSSMLSISGSSVVTFMYDSIVSSVGTIVAFFSFSSSPPPSDDAKSESLLIDVVLDEKKATMEEKVLIDVILDEKNPEKENNKEEVTSAPVEVPTTMINVDEIDQMIKEIVTAVSTSIDEELKI